MPPAIPDRPAARLRPALIGIALLTLWRVALLPFDRADLFVDEAQYWLWGQELAWGYFSKPPLIGWILHVSTLASDAPFWIRLPLPLIHGATAVTVALVGRHLFGARTGGLAGFAFASLPGVAVGSLLVSTDTPMLLCFALAIAAHMRLAAGGSTAMAVGLGAAVGVGLLAKYAMIYFPVAGAVAALLIPGARIRWRDAGVAAAVAVAIVTPNLAWNAAHKFSTLEHTAGNADWHGMRLDLAGLAEFVGGQFAVAGPVLFTAYLAGLIRLRPFGRAYAAALSLPVFAIVSVQAALAGANANWAAAGHIGAALLAASVLAGRPRLLAVGLGLNLAVSLALPVAAAFADRWQMGGRLVLARHVGQAEVSRWAEDVARAEGLDTIVAPERATLADLVYTLRDSGLAIAAPPPDGPPCRITMRPDPAAGARPRRSALRQPLRAPALRRGGGGAPRPRAGLCRRQALPRIPAGPGLLVPVSGTDASETGDSVASCCALPADPSYLFRST